MTELDKAKRPAVCDAWDAYRARPELLAKIDQLEKANQLLANRFNQAIAQRDDWIDKAAEYLKTMDALSHRTWVRIGRKFGFC